MPTASLLVVEDDDDLRETLARRFREEGYAVDTAAAGPDALDAVAERVPDLVILDVMLPGLDGVEVCRRLRAEHPLLYILMLTAKAGELDRVVGLEVGADDYVTKPFSLPEVVARVRAALRRVQTVREQLAAGSSADDDAPIVAGPLTVDTVRREVTVDGAEVHLTVREFDLLAFLAGHPDRPFTRSQLLEKIWAITYEGYDRTIDSHVQRLRAKIEADPGDPQFVRTVWGVGYKFSGTVDP
ncbi:response regulator transcription factor [Rubrivirga sp. IMCC45206]|uniref:response regulator transcription factor n=1 Tax=Rubrivirga sp. IMCC45206 TaxID=3391614 RepID=UPI00398F9CFF